MDNDLFLQRLQQLATVKPVKPPRNPGVRDAAESNIIFRNGDTFEIDKKKNSTLNWAVTSIKHDYKPCEDCGKQILNRRIWHRIFQQPTAHWRTTCSGCNLTQHPETKQYVVANSSVTSVFREWLNTRDK
jgi:hypothetical protein